MDHNYQKFYTALYNRTGGYMPTAPFGQIVFPGDYFQIVDGEMIVLGNIFASDIIDKEDVTFEWGVKLDESNWNFNQGVTRPYSGRSRENSDINGEFTINRTVFAFDSAGSFNFNGQEPEAIRIKNWQDVDSDLIVKLTQSFHSFRDVYIVSEVASASSWTLAISGSDKGELEVATESETFGLTDIFGHHDTKTIQSKDLEYYHRESIRTPLFFKGKRLSLQSDKITSFLNDIIVQKDNRYNWASELFDNYKLSKQLLSTNKMPGDVTHLLLGMMSAGDLNPNTALNFFYWTEMNMDDLLKMFK